MLQAVVEDYRRDRMADAARARLIAIAACCRTSTLSRAVASVTSAARAVLRGGHRPQAAACCA
jgi:hypothetical protein